VVVTFNGREIPLVEGRMRIGRESDNDLVLDDVQVSRYHALLEVDDAGRLTVTDLGSANGTLVGQKSVRGGSMAVNDGDTLRFGDANVIANVPTPSHAGLTVRDRPTVHSPRRVLPADGAPEGKKLRWGGTTIALAVAAVAGVVVAVLLLTGAFSSGHRTTKVQALTEPQLIAKAGPGVVHISASKGETETLGPVESGGTGIIINAEKGFILTNAHVVSGAAALHVRVNDKTDVPAQILAQAPCDDLAVLRMTSVPPGIKALTLGDSNQVKAGDPVTVLGYPETLPKDVTELPRVSAAAGIVSQPDTSARIGGASIKYPALIQHQATINHGNSGGPLLDSSGSVVGINTLTAAGFGTGQIQGQYYSIASAHAQQLMPELQSGQSVANLGWNLIPLDRQYLESKFGPQVDNVVRTLVSVNDVRGLVVNSVDPGSAAAAASFTPGDYISQINGSPVTSVQSICDVAQSAPSGSTIRIGGRYLASAPAAGKRIGEPFIQDLKVP
jgi:S1-C subfamily serine protease